MNKQTQNGFSSIIIIVIILIVVGVGGTFYVIQKKEGAQKSEVTPPASSATKTKTITEWQRYENELGFSFEYPSDWKVGNDPLNVFDDVAQVIVIYDPVKVDLEKIDGKEVGLFEVWNSRAGFHVTIAETEEQYLNQFALLPSDTFDSYEEPSGYEGNLEEMVIAGYHAAKFMIYQPESDRIILAAWRDDRYAYVVDQASYNQEGGDSIMRQHEAILDHIMETFQGVGE